MRILVAQIGARRHYAVPAALQAAGMLERLVTTACAAHPLASLAKLPIGLVPRQLRRLAERQVPDVDPSRIRSILQLDLDRWIAPKPRTADERYRHWARQNRRFGEIVCRSGFGAADAVYGFNAAALEIFQAGKHAHKLCILDQTMAPFDYVEPLLATERERWPGWEEDVDSESWRELADRERAEWELADVIICGSPFVVESIAACNGPVEKCRVAGYGYPGAVFASQVAASDRTVRNGPLRVLFAGTLCLRKGIPYVGEAARCLAAENVEFRTVGPIEIDRKRLTLSPRFDVRGPVSRKEMSEHYAWADVLVAPSLAEGSANVVLEAMAAGVPAIVTNATGACVIDSQEGTIVPVRDASALAAAIRHYAQDRTRLNLHSATASSRVREMTASRYSRALLAAISARSDDVTLNVNQLLTYVETTT